MNKTTAKLITLSSSEWQKIQAIGIKIPQSEFSIAKINPYNIFKQVVNAQNRKWLVLMCKAILDYYNIKILYDKDNYCLGITEQGSETASQIERTFEFLNDLTDK